MVVPTAPRPFTIAEMTADPIRLNSQLGSLFLFRQFARPLRHRDSQRPFSSGVPMGVTLLAPAWADENVAEIARLFERHRPEAVSP